MIATLNMGTDQSYEENRIDSSEILEPYSVPEEEVKAKHIYF
jgi:hypothetical protein